MTTSKFYQGSALNGQQPVAVANEALLDDIARALVPAPKPCETRGSLEILRDMRHTADDMIDLAIVCGGELDACTAQVGGELLRQLALELAKGGK